MNDRTLKSLRPKRGAPQTYFDTQSVGLALRVGARKSSWFFVYRNGGQPQWLSLGAFPAVSLKDARGLVLDHRHALDVDGVDPMAERRKAAEPAPPTPEEFTVAKFAPAFVTFQKNRGNKDWKNDEQKIARHIVPAWGAMPLREVTRRHVQELLDGLVSRGMSVGVNRVQALVSRIFAVALDRGLIDAHPATRIIKRFPETPRERVLSDDELRALWSGLDARPGAASDAVRLRLLLGQRGKEVADMQWSEVDLDAALWTLPRPRTKTRKRAHPVPLAATALDILKRRRKLVADDEPRVFPGLRLQGKDHSALAELHGGAWTWKDLRRTVSTRLTGLGFTEAMAGRVLNHISHTITGKHYDQHQYVEEIRTALEAWDRELNRILRNEPKPKGRVVPMKRR